MKNIKFEELNINPLKAIAKDTMLITAGDQSSFNTMTASWGQLGSLWGYKKNTATAVIYIRPTRYTKEFVDREEYFSLCFFDEKYQKDLAYLGSHSGRDEDKLAKTNLSASFEKQAPYFKEANIVLICRKLYAQDIKEECFCDKDIVKNSYPLKDFHTMYVAEIVETLIDD